MTQAKVVVACACVQKSADYARYDRTTSLARRQGLGHGVIDLRSATASPSVVTRPCTAIFPPQLLRMTLTVATTNYALVVDLISRHITNGIR